MIRIDEIYNHTLWPWIKSNLPLTRLFFMDPFGSTDPQDLKNFGHDVAEHNYIFMHDQEPIDLVLHHNLFDAVRTRNLDLNHNKGPTKSAIITSETQSNNLDRVCDLYRWRPFYYFFHGWAALDWYRGYDKTFLIQSPQVRRIQASFLAPNRIIGGQRDHRPLLIYHLIKHGVRQALISCPKICPQENLPIEDILSDYRSHYPDIIDVVTSVDLPWNIGHETGHPMTSCWLDLFPQAETTLAYVVTETVFFGKRMHITEKSFKPICLGMPFILASTRGALKYLRSYGFQTFHDFWDESYDEESDDLRRLEMIADLLARLDRMTTNQRQDLYAAMLPVIHHNYNHFYHGAFEHVLWKEFQTMLQDLKIFFSQP